MPPSRPRRASLEGASASAPGSVAYSDEHVNTRRMRFVPLSDHPGDMLAEARRAREAAGGAAGERYRRQLAAREARIAEAGERRHKSRVERDFLSWLRWGLIAWWRRLARPPRP